MASSTLLTLIVIPAIYAVVKGIRLLAGGPADILRAPSLATGALSGDS
jgi:hypothetical protein